MVRISPILIALWSETNDPEAELQRDPTVCVGCRCVWISSSGSGISATLLFFGAQDVINSAMRASSINRTILYSYLHKPRCLDTAVDQFIGVGVLDPDYLVQTTIGFCYSGCG